MRDLLLRLALTDLFQAHWSERIHEEWIRSVQRQRPDLEPEQLQRTRELMNLAVPDSLVTAFEPLIDQLSLPDPDDRHVLAAAIRCQATVNVTYNLTDFPPTRLDRGIEAQHPDDFISRLHDHASAMVCTAVRSQRSALKNPPRSIQDLLDYIP